MHWLTGSPGLPSLSHDSHDNVGAFRGAAAPRERMPPKSSHLSQPTQRKSRRAKLLTGFMGAPGGKDPSTMVRSEEGKEGEAEAEEGSRKRREWSIGEEADEDDDEEQESEEEEDNDNGEDEEDVDEDKEEAAEAAEAAAEEGEKSWSTDDDELVIGAMQAKGHLMFIDDICDDLEHVFEHRLPPRSSAAIR